MPNLDFPVTNEKTFRELCKDVIDRSQNKKDQIDMLFTDVRGYIKNINDAQVFLPRIKELLDVGVKNDEQLIKLAAVIQRLESTQLEATGGDPSSLTEEEKEQLLQTMATTKIKEIKAEVESITLPSTSSIS